MGTDAQRATLRVGVVAYHQIYARDGLSGQGAHQWQLGLGKRGSVRTEPLVVIGPGIQPFKGQIQAEQHPRGRVVYQDRAVGVGDRDPVADAADHRLEQCGLLCRVVVGRFEPGDQGLTFVAMQRQCQRHQTDDHDERLREQDPKPRRRGSERSAPIHREYHHEDSGQQHVNRCNRRVETQADPHAQRHEQEGQRNRNRLTEHCSVGRGQDQRRDHQLGFLPAIEPRHAHPPVG